jgi:branched-chain amino acid transport system permease protein
MAKAEPRTWAAAALLLALACVPLVSAAVGQDFYVTFFSRVLIFGLAAVGLNLVLGYGGLVSLGHALYIGVGVYAVGILSEHGIGNGWAHLAVALLASAIVAAVTGVVCLRTSGMAFIMITLAFAQMVYFVAVSLRRYGGDDGLAIGQRSDFGLFTLANGNVRYYVIFGLLLAVLYGLRRLVDSRFGTVLQGCKFNEQRMAALGFPTLRYKLAAYVISAMICALAGVMLANLVLYMSPSYMQWQVSGELIVMIVLGGMGSLIGPVLGAVVLLALEELLASIELGLPWGLDALIKSHPMLLISVFIVAVALTMKHGLYGRPASRKPAGAETKPKEPARAQG